jgi:hypothetical protein
VRSPGTSYRAHCKPRPETAVAELGIASCATCIPLNAAAALVELEQAWAGSCNPFASLAALARKQSTLLRITTVGDGLV